MSESRSVASLDKVILRLPDGLRDRLNEVARANGRSANSEAVQALRAWLFPESQEAPYSFSLPDELLDMVSRAAKRSQRATRDEIIERLTATFSDEPNGSGLDLRAEIRSAMHEAVEGLLADPERLKRLGYAPPKRDKGDEPVSG